MIQKFYFDIELVKYKVLNGVEKARKANPKNGDDD